VGKQYKKCGEPLCLVVIAAFKKNKVDLKKNLHTLMLSMYEDIDDKSHLKTILKVFSNKSLLNLLWEVAFIEDNKMSS
jgi:hypothetical protein